MSYFGKWNNINATLVWNQSFNEKLLILLAKIVSFFYFIFFLAPVLRSRVTGGVSVNVDHVSVFHEDRT
jgi:hypothetical protein